MKPTENSSVYVYKYIYSYAITINIREVQEILAQQNEATTVKGEQNCLKEYMKYQQFQLIVILTRVYFNEFYKLTNKVISPPPRKTKKKKTLKRIFKQTMSYVKRKEKSSVILPLSYDHC